MSTPDPRIDELAAALEVEYGAQRARDLADACRRIRDESATRRADEPLVVVFDSPDLRFAGHFEPQHDLVVVDPDLGSIGIVLALDDGAATGDLSPEERAAIGDAVNRAVREATYVRHLLVTDSRIVENGHRRGRTYSVELVLLIGDRDAATRDTACAELVGERLQQLALDERFLHAVGVHILRWPSDQTARRRELRRAFCWLLQATRLWYRTRASRRERTDGSTLRQIVLDGFRLASRRVIDLAEDARLHLVFGRNGSGKSALAEALELSLTGQVRRLRDSDVEDYRPILTNRDRYDETRPETGARIELTTSAGELPPLVVEKDGLTTPLAADLSADAFRLDQALMDRLVSATTSERAAVFLQAFFPEERAALQEHADALQSVAANGEAVQKLYDRLSQARRILDRLRSWSTTVEATAADDWPRTLNEWLEAHALTDVARKLDIVATSLGHGTDRAPAQLAHLPASLRDPLEALQEGLSGQNWAGLLTELEARTTTLENKIMADAATAAASPATSRTAITPPAADEIRVLDEVGEFVLKSGDAHGHRTLGRAIVESIRYDRQVSVDSRTTVGSTSWASHILGELDSILETLSRCISGARPQTWPGQGKSCREFEDARKIHERLEATEQKLETAFFRKLGTTVTAEAGAFRNADPENPPDGLLNAALNEVLALCTPARWAYEEIEFRVTADGGVALRVDGEPGELLFNTAELNLFTVVLFLLCAVRRDNPLNLLLFDDPLQNMDELTVRTLARGLAKVTRLWKLCGREWRILMLFHGEGDLERFRAEIPAAVYDLPWLTPDAPPNEAPRRPDAARSNLSDRIQQFGPLVGDDDAANA